MNLALATTLYTLAEKASGETHCVSYAELKAFALQLKAFEQQLGEDKQDNYWQPKLRSLKGYRFRLCAAPLPFDDPDKRYAERFRHLERELTNCHNIYPQFAAQTQELVKQACALTQLTDNPLLEHIRHLELPDNSALLIKKSRFVESLEVLLSKILELRHLHVVTPPQLRGEAVWEHLVIVGPMRWFPDYIVTAPRARHLHIVRYKFVGGGWQPRVHFVHQKDAPPRIIKPADEPETEIVDAEEVLPIDWDAISAHIAHPANNDQEFVEARRFILENDNVVFLEDGGSELVIDISGEGAVRRIKVNNLEPDMFLIVREKGSGNYIVPFANRILGDRATQERQNQQHWKEELRKAVLTKGMANVLSGLKRMGARTASEQNIRNWMSASERKIRPRHHEDFSAIMEYLGLSEQTEIYWKSARNINRAHHMAGIRMKNLLLSEVKKANLRRLEQRGYQSFTFAEYETSIQAFRIIKAIPKKVSIPLSKIGELVEV